MKFVVLCVLCFCALKFKLAIEVSPERHELEYYNRKYLRHMSVTFRKRGRHSPHYVNMELDAYVGCGNNLTVRLKVKMMLYEFLSGHYIPTPIQGEYKLCDFLYKEPFFGQMYAKQLPGNWSCPFPPGKYNFTNLVIHLENFPYNIPFTYTSLIVRTRVDVQGIFTTTNEEVFRWKTYVKVTQKIQKPKSKNKQALKKNNTAALEGGRN